MKLCLDSLTLNNTEPADLIRCARLAEFDMVSLWAQPPSILPAQLLTAAKLPACKAALAETGIVLGPLEVFDLSSAEAVKSYRPALELGAALGAKTASAINVRNANPTHVSELFAQLAELAREYGMGVTLEPLAKFPTATLAQARDIIRASRVDAGLVLDAFHLVRQGGTAADVNALGPGFVRHVQLCDGPAVASLEETRYQSTYERMYPGEGDFPLTELLSNVSTEISWGIEAPSRLRGESGASAEMLAKQAMAAIRGTLEKIAVARRF
jgi:sugar phosphate isomerase/epimerase